MTRAEHHYRISYRPYINRRHLLYLFLIKEPDTLFAGKADCFHCIFVQSDKLYVVLRQ